MNYREIRRATVWSYEFYRRIDGRVPPAEGTRPYEKLTIPTDLAIAHITLLVAVKARTWPWLAGRSPGKGFKSFLRGNDLKPFSGLLPESQGQVLALNVLIVPCLRLRARI